jgi:hypothetical protein
MTTMNAPMSFDLTPVDVKPIADTGVKTMSSDPGTTKLLGVFSVSLVWSFFTLLGMLTAQMWMVDRFVIPQIEKAYHTELTSPMPVIPTFDEVEEVVDAK